MVNSTIPINHTGGIIKVFESYVILSHPITAIMFVIQIDLDSCRPNTKNQDFHVLPWTVPLLSICSTKNMIANSCQKRDTIQNKIKHESAKKNKPPTAQAHVPPLWNFEVYGLLQPLRLLRPPRYKSLTNRMDDCAVFTRFSLLSGGELEENPPQGPDIPQAAHHSRLSFFKYFYRVLFAADPFLLL